MMKRLITMLTALMLLCSLMGSTMAEVKQAGTFYTRTADPETLDGWEKLFGANVNTTENVGTVWTDKTVTTSVPSATEFQSITMENDQENFLVTLSALSATKSITGHETLPTDTVFVLDLSSSMYRIDDNNYSTATVGPMVDAANEAIHKLLDLNPLNRVGVVIYYGFESIWRQSDTTHHVSLLQLDSFDLLDDQKYLVMNTDSSNRLRGIKVNDNLKVRGTNTKATTTPYVMPGKLSDSSSNIAGTYMQLGIKKALDMMLQSDPHIPADEGFQAGATRIPIMVLMSDGEPTAAHNLFSKLETPDDTEAITGNNVVNERSAAESDFLTQLTAGMARKVLDMHYDATTPLFYTLGLGTSLSYDVMDPRNNDVKYNGDTATLAAQYTCNTGRAHANYPSGTTNLPSGGNAEYQNTKEQVNAKIKTYWNDILSGDNKATITYLRNVNWAWKRSQTATVSAISTYTGGGKTFTFSEPFPSSIEDKYYVDKFFSANTASELSTAFSSLVEEIKLQSAYFPTYVENGAIGMSGYLEFHDEIGDMLQVQKVHGLVRQATAEEKKDTDLNYFYYTGKQLAEYVKNARNDATKLAEFKVVLGKLLKVRFKITDEATVQAAVDEIIKPANKMFYYVSETDYGNIIRWYADAKEEFVGLKTADTTTAPAKAVYLMESYWYADTTSAAAMEDYNSIIRIKTDLETGKQCVLWSVPASMIPLVRYEVTLRGNSLENPGTIKVDYTSNNPMRAVIEVGLRDGVTKYNAVEELTKAGYQPDEDGKYTFFSNKWTETLPNPSVNSIHDTHNTTSHFKPSLQNERYNITADTLVYVKDGEGYKEYTGDSKPSSGGKYYVVNYAFKAQGDKWNAEDNEADLVPSYMLLTSGFGNAKKVDGKWYISTGTATYPDDQYIEKDPNTTQSVIYSFYETERDEEQVVSILGNNGTFSFVPDTGMTITKKLSGNETTAQDFTFIITPADEGRALASSYNVTWLENGQALENGEAVATSTSGNKLTVVLQAGQKVYIPGLPAGDYTVLEQVYAEDGFYTYEVSAVKVDSSAVRDPAAASAVTVTANQMIAVEYTNRKVETGSIKIEKTTTSSVAGITLPADQAFTFQVELGEDNANKSFPLTWADNATGTAEADATGMLTVAVKANDHVIISGVPRNTSATVTEINLPDGYAVAQGTLNPQTQTVEEGQTASFVFANVYTPEKAPVTITLTGEKTLTGRDWLDSDTFSFQLQYKAGDTWTDFGDAVTVSKASTSFDLTEAMESFIFDEPGTYSFRVVELGGSIPGISYDTGADAFDVVIADEDVDGVLEIKAVTAVSGAEVTSGSNGFAVATAFTNYYTSVILEGTKTLTGRELKDNEFTFVLTETESDFATAKAGGVSQTATNMGGTFTFAEIPYVQAGTYYYTIAEQPGSLPGVTYDSTVYYVKVVVTDNTQSGKLEVATTYQTKDEQGAFVNAEAVAFANSYKAADNTATFSGVKTLTGRELKDNEFTFVLTETESDFVTVKADGEQQTATNSADGSFFFEKIEYKAAGTYYYTVTEDESTPLASVTYDKTIYQITVTVVDNTANGTLDVTTVVTKASKEAATEGIALAADPIPLEYDELYFNNVYDAVDTSVILEGSKTLEGRALADNEFTFVLTETESDFATAKTNGVSQTATNMGGTFTFAEIPYVQAGTHYYTIAEQTGSLPGVTYDGTVYYATVTVTDNTTTGKLEVSVTYQTKDEQGAFVNAEAVAFANSYKAADNTATFSGKKTLTGRELAAGEFTFVLTETESDFATAKAGGEQQTATNSADGSFSFEEIEYKAAGTYYYTVTEDESTPLASVTYDKTIYQITVSVVDNTANGTLDVKAVVNKASKEAAMEGIALAADPIPLEYDELDFNNVYDAVDTSVILEGTKTLTGRELKDNEFTFVLTETESDFATAKAGGVSQTATNMGGAFTFAEIPYVQAGTYYYTIAEQPGSLPGVTYDSTVYYVKVVVTDNTQSGKLEVATTYQTKDEQGAFVNAEAVAFANSYKAADNTATFSGKKTLTGRELAAGEFTFVLTETESDFTTPKTNGVTQTATNSADGSFFFEEIDYDTAGTYYYTVTEDESTPLASVTYDKTIYQITVTVVDNTANGTLDVTAVVNKASKEAATEGIALAADPIPLEYNELDFLNVYDAVDTSIVLNGNKTLMGRILADKEFTFTLYNADAEYNIISEVETVANDAEGKFAFTEIPYDTVGAYYYVVRENSASVPYITTDAAEYRIQVDVKDMGGELAAECTALRVADGEGTAEDIIADGMSFTNHYVPFSVSVALRGEKRYTGAALEEGMFTFQLYAADSNFNPIGLPQQNITNKADGTFVFRTLTFGGTGVYRYVIVEDASQALPGVTYDPTVYQVTITVSDHGTGYLVADVSISSNGEEAEKAVFENFYHEIPNTGDHSSIEFMLALCLTSLTALMAMMILGRRRVRG